jgi:hypothetical protein
MECIYNFDGKGRRKETARKTYTKMGTILKRIYQIV